MNGVAPQVKGVRRIIRLEQDPAGGYAPIVLYDRSNNRKKKKTTKLLRPVERLLRQISDAQSTTAIEYQARHRRSSEKKKNGWLKDLGRNLSKSQRRGRKRIKVKKILNG